MKSGELKFWVLASRLFVRIQAQADGRLHLTEWLQVHLTCWQYPDDGHRMIFHTSQSIFDSMQWKFFDRLVWHTCDQDFEAQEHC